MVKRSFTAVFLAGAVWIAGCQETSSIVAPEGLVTFESNHKECPGHPSCKPDDGDSAGQDVGTFRFTFSGPYVSGVIGPFTEAVKGGTRILHGNQGNTVDGSPDPLTFSPAFIAAFADGETCFADNPFTGPVSVALRKKDGYAGSQFFFTAIGTDGLEEDYMLGMRGEFDGSAWPPEVGGSNTVTGFLLGIDHNSSHPKCAATIEEAGAYTVVVERLE